jgi:alkyldihydroxyacetonephosphate synthase
VPYGGGTNVTQSLMLPIEEKRMIVSVDMSRMNAIKWVDKENNLACVQCGIIGTDLERDLKQYGVISGHEPDSMEFSSLGGWISTRASGMKKNTYGNIEDIVQNITMVTSKGTYNKVAAWPRISNGPDLNHLVMGSEGNYGIITEAVIKVKPLPEVRIFDSILFYDWESGVKFMHAVSKTKNYPTSCRLVDNQQF